MKSVLNLISGITAAVMTICAIPAQQIAAAGDPAQEITKISCSGSMTHSLQGIRRHIPRIFQRNVPRR